MRRGLVGLTVALALVVAGCGKGGAEESGGGSASSGEAAIKTGPGATADTITLGYLPDLSGVFAPNGKAMMEGANLYWDAKNKAGGICGRQIKVTVQDTGYDPQKAVAAYQQMSGDVIGLGLVLGSSIVSALLPNVQQENMFLNFAGWTSDILPERERGHRGHDLRHRGHQRRRLPDEGEGHQGGRQGRAPLLRGRLRRERAQGLEVRRGQASAQDRRAEDHARRPGHDRPGGGVQEGRREGDPVQRRAAAGRVAGGRRRLAEARRPDRGQRPRLDAAAAHHAGRRRADRQLLRGLLDGAAVGAERGRAEVPVRLQGRATRRARRPRTARSTPTRARRSPTRR